MNYGTPSGQDIETSKLPKLPASSDTDRALVELALRLARIAVLHRSMGKPNICRQCGCNYPCCTYILAIGEQP